LARFFAAFSVSPRWLALLLLGTCMSPLPGSAQEPGPATSMAAFCDALPRPAYAGLPRIPSASDWFELYRVAPGVTAIYEPYQWQEVISYLIEGSESALLFDTGNGIADIAEVVAGLTALPVAVLNSHTHYDHVGGNHAFAGIYGLDTPFTRSRQAGYRNSDIALEVSPGALCKPLPAGVSPASHRGRPFTISRFINDGHVLDLGERRLEVVSVPGHTPDAIVLLDRDNGLMWTGDSFYEGPIWLYATETDLSAYADSLQKMVELVPGLRALLPAHNTPWVSPGVLLQVREGLRRTLAGEARAVEQGPGMVEYIPPGVSGFSFLMRSDSLPRR
jgi:glyoxylase-like metal-dependent hydrolase (beta-lactamase superfamily II)